MSPIAHVLRVAAGRNRPVERRNSGLIEGSFSDVAACHPPREILVDELTEFGVTPTELSRQINVPPNRVTQIVHGRYGITGGAALRLELWFGTSAQFRLDLPSAYDIRVAEEPRSPTPAIVAGKREAAKVAESCRASFFGDIFLTEAPGVPILFFRWMKGA